MLKSIHESEKNFPEAGMHKGKYFLRFKGLPTHHGGYLESLKMFGYHQDIIVYFFFIYVLSK